MDFRDLLAPPDEPPTMTRNGTPLSRYSESIVRTFLTYGAEQAQVRLDLAEYGLEELYEGMRKVARKNDYKHLVKVHRQNGKIMLLRKIGDTK